MNRLTGFALVHPKKKKYCWPCLLFQPKSSQPWTDSGYNNFWNILSDCKHHSKSLNHRHQSGCLHWHGFRSRKILIDLVKKKELYDMILDEFSLKPRRLEFMFKWRKLIFIYSKIYQLLFSCCFIKNNIKIVTCLRTFYSKYCALRIVIFPTR